MNKIHRELHTTFEKNFYTYEMIFKIETVINRDIITVYDFLTGLERLPWHTHQSVKEYCKLTDGAFTIGSKYKETIMYRKWKFQTDSEVVQCIKPTAIAYTWTGKQMKGILKYNLSALNNKTHIRQIQTLNLDGFLRILNPIIYLIFQRQITKRLRSIKYLLDNNMEEIKSFTELHW